MLRARSTTTLTPYQESMVSASQFISKKEQSRIVDRLHSDAKFKQEMHVIYNQVKLEKEMQNCTFVPNKGIKKKMTARKKLNKNKSEQAFMKQKGTIECYTRSNCPELNQSTL